MIEINLVPDNLRKRRKSSSASSGINIPLEVIIGLGGGLVIILVLIHVLLLGVNVTRLSGYKSLQAQWAKIEPDKKKVDGIITELRELQKRNKDISDSLLGKRNSWSQKLNILSDCLSKGVWFKKISFIEDKFLIEGSAVSRQYEEMTSVHSFMASLKANKDFSKNLSDLELGSIQRKKIKELDIVDFVITAKLDMPKEQTKK